MLKKLLIFGVFELSLLLGNLAYAEDMATLMARCAPKVNAITLSAMVRTESSGYVFVLSDDGPRNLPWKTRKTMLRNFYPDSAKEAAAIAKDLIDSGHLVGIGLTQISSQHLPKLGVTLEDLLDPCMNLRIGGQMLSDLYASASKQFKGEDAALGAALSAFNTGNFEDGFTNGYVQKVVANLSGGVPELKTAALRHVPRSTSGPNAGAGRIAVSRPHSSERLDAKFSKLEVEFN